MDCLYLKMCSNVIFLNGIRYCGMEVSECARKRILDARKNTTPLFLIKNERVRYYRGDMMPNLHVVGGADETSVA